jgi:hypothetical protein
MVSADFFVLPTIGFRVLLVFVILKHDRRRSAYFFFSSLFSSTMSGFPMEPSVENDSDDLVRTMTPA